MKPTRKTILLFAALTASSLSAADVASNWKNLCAKCHGSDGRGDTRAGRKLFISDLTDAKLQAKFTDEEAARAIMHGLKDAKGKVIMKAIPDMSEEEVRVLVARVRAMQK